MYYEGAVYRPPSEAYSLIVQATIGCAHNRCTFCYMYKGEKFRVRELKEVINDLKQARTQYPRVRRIFIADGDALSIPYSQLEKILITIKEIYPECERVGIYACPRDLLEKTLEELKGLKELGLGIIYMGLESGSDEVLQAVHKGVTAQEAIEAGQKAVTSGIQLSLTVISGLGGRANWQTHAIETGKVLSRINPRYVGLLTLMLQEGTTLKRQIDQGKFQLLSPEEIMKETRLMLEHTAVTACIFRSNHASNYVSLRGTLPQDKKNLLEKIDGILNHGFNYKHEYFRGL